MDYTKTIPIKVGSHIEQRSVHHLATYDAEGNIVPAYDEEVNVVVDDYESVTVEMTEEEKAEVDRVIEEGDRINELEGRV